MYIGALPACMFLYHLHAWCSQRPLEHVRRVTNTHELLCAYREMNPGPFEEQPVLLTSELSLQSQWTVLSLSITPGKTKTLIVQRLRDCCLS